MSSNATMLSKFGFNPDITWTHIFMFLFMDPLKSIKLRPTVFFTIFLLLFTLSVDGSADSIDRPVKVPEVEINKVSEIKELTLLVKRQSEMIDEQSGYNNVLVSKTKEQGQKLKEAIVVIDKLTLANRQLGEKVKALERRLREAETSLQESERLANVIFN